MLAENFQSRFSSYSGISEMIKTHSLQELISHITTLVNADVQTLLRYPMGCFLKGSKHNTYLYVLEDLKKHITRYDKVYELLADETSQLIFLHLIQYRLIPDAQFLKLAYDLSTQHPLEQTSDSDSLGLADTAKTTIESFDVQTLLAKKDSINTDAPSRAFYAHSIISDLWEIPLLLHSIQPKYRFHLRHYHPAQNRETVVYTISPPVQNKDTVKPFPKNAVALPWREGWINVELTKDCGLIPYLLHKNHQMNVTMAGADKGPYPYLEEYVSGLRMDFLENGSNYDKAYYILEHGKENDLLLLRGAYDINIDAARQYKQVHPNGKIYLGLDANSHWMDRIRFDRPEFMEFMNRCDVIATSCRALQKHLNEKWPWKIEYIPNGYYNYGIVREAPDFNAKENVILTVSRLGTPQKATDILLDAFALIADKLPNWKLKLVGSMDPSFLSFKEDFFQKHPGLASRIEFTGVISDKEKLFEEYRKAKVFALPSTFEGGTPNVVAEALTAGCAMAVTKFDAWEDAIDDGRCGMAAEINDTTGFAEILTTLCTHPEPEILSKNAYDYAMRNYDMESVVAKLYELLFGGDFI